MEPLHYFAPMLLQGFIAAFIFFTLPLDTVRTLCKLGLKRLLVTLWA